MPTRRSRDFCKALHQEIGDDPLRWTTITAVADRLGIEQDKAEALAAELDEEGLVRVGGGPQRDAPAGWLAASQEAGAIVAVLHFVPLTGARSHWPARTSR